MKWMTVIGFIAAAFTTLAFLPQVIKTWRIRETKDISLLMYVIFLVGVFLWLCYGVLLGDYPISIANAVTFILALIILIAKIKYG
ncbi:MAG: SemiSWEET transporter [PVC group bacterium]